MFLLSSWTQRMLLMWKLMILLSSTMLRMLWMSRLLMFLLSCSRLRLIWKSMQMTNPLSSSFCLSVSWCSYFCCFLLQSNANKTMVSYTPNNNNHKRSAWSTWSINEKVESSHPSCIKSPESPLWWIAEEEITTTTENKQARSGPAEEESEWGISKKVWRSKNIWYLLQSGISSMSNQSKSKILTKTP